MGVETTLFDLTGRVALLTGASKGMGLYMAEGLAEHGAKVVVSSRKLDQCEAAVQQINAKCGEERAIAIACNIGYKEQLESLVAETRSRLGPSTSWSPTPASIRSTGRCRRSRTPRSTRS